MVLVVSDGVARLPDIPVTPGREDVHDSLSLDDQVIVVAVPEATIEGVAETDTVVVMDLLVEAGL